MKIVIKKATIKNFKDIQALNKMLFEKECREYDPTLNCAWPLSREGVKYFKDRITKKDGCAFVVYYGKQVVGYINGGFIKKYTHRNNVVAAELENMFILDEFRGKGIGTKLFQALKKWCKTKKVSKLRVFVFASNMQAIEFYQRRGFKDYEKIMEVDI